MTNVEQALELIADGMALGLGSGHAAERFVEALGQRVRAGLRVRCVPTSARTASRARAGGLSLVSLSEAMPLEATIDGADEVDPNLDLIKGYGRALVREKIVAAASARLIILIGPEQVADKVVAVLGSRGKLPVEVVPFAMPLCRRRFEELGCPAEVVMSAGEPFISENGNCILECAVGAIHDPRGLEHALQSVPGVVATGLFLGMADTVLIQDGDRVEVRQRTIPTRAEDSRP